MPLDDVFDFLVGFFAANDIPYAIVGGIAASALGEPRFTRDVDAVIAIRPEAVADFLARIEQAGVPVARRSQIEHKLKDGKPAKVAWGRTLSFDIRIASFSVDREAIAHPVKARIRGKTVRIASPEAMIVYKLARSDRPEGHRINHQGPGKAH